MTPTTRNWPANPTGDKLVRDVERYLSKYVTFPERGYSFVLALWALSTHLWPHFDAFPYLVITSSTKRSGKTRLSELLAFVAANAKNMAGMTAATVFRMIRDDQPTLFIDEAETLSSESADTMRSVLNVGYRQGQTIPRMSKGGKVEEWPAYCPKAFILIGDVFDTLRDRSIVVRMRRGEAPQRFIFENARAEGRELCDRAATGLLDGKASILEAYSSHAGLSFLQDRDEEIWTPLFCVASVLCPDRLDELTRIAVDMATEKTVGARKFSALEMETAEREATDQEYAERLLVDVATVIGKHKGMFTNDLLKALFDLPTGPWRKFRGAGLDAHDLSNLLNRFAIVPKLLRLGETVKRGYSRADIERGLKQL